MVTVTYWQAAGAILGVLLLGVIAGCAWPRSTSVQARHAEPDDERSVSATIARATEPIPIVRDHDMESVARKRNRPEAAWESTAQLPVIVTPSSPTALPRATLVRPYAAEIGERDGSGRHSWRDKDR